MNGKKAKAIRKIVYGEKTFRDRKYYRNKNDNVIADHLRRIYQNAKKVA